MSAVELVHGLTLCAEKCGRDAELTADPDERWAKHICFECVELLIERENAIFINRGAVELIDRATKNFRYRPLPPPRIDLETADYTKLNALVAQWRAYELALNVTPRCWAIVARGTRCVRDEASAGLCDTHLHLGARLPGLGWAGDEPVGAIVVRQPQKEEAKEGDARVPVRQEAVHVVQSS